jgi:PIN domain nuclease of toxin-antitoxin system
LILLDTHVLLWLAVGAPQLGRRARASIDRALHRDGVAVSAISYWEIAILVARGRLRQHAAPEDLRARCSVLSIDEVAINGSIAITAARLGVGRDPADRLIGATALELRATLVTADETLLAWKGGPKLLDAGR